MTDSKTGLQLNGPGGFAYSASEDILSSWKWGVAVGSTVYNFTVKLTNGSALTLAKRERPKLLFDDIGRPSILFNVVSFRGGTHTFAQRIVAWNPPYTT